MRNTAQDIYLKAQESSLLRTQDTGPHLPTKDKGLNAGRSFSLLSLGASCQPPTTAQSLSPEIEPPTVAIRGDVLLLSNNLPDNVQVFYWHIQEVPMKSYETARYALVL